MTTSQGKKMPQIIRQLVMSEQCTICKKTFDLGDSEQPNVIEIDIQYFCESCLEAKLLEEQQNIRALEERYIYYKQYESSFNTREYEQTELEHPNSQKLEDLAELQRLQKQSHTLDELLLKANEQCKSLKQKVLHIEAEEEKFWDSINRFEKRSLKLEEKSLTAKLELRTFKTDAQSLCKNSLYHEVFKITIQDNISYISGLAMGKRPDGSQIVWEQFNIGLGHLFLALNIFALKYEYSFVKMQKIQLKSHLSQVHLYGKQKNCPIAYSKQNEKQFGEVMEAVLTEVYHFSYHLMEVLNLEYNPDVKLPYPIKEKQYKIADVFINPTKIVEKHKWVKWSEAVKYLLIDWKHLMTVHVIYGKD